MGTKASLGATIRGVWRALPRIGKIFVTLCFVAIVYAAIGTDVERWVRWHILRPPIPSDEAKFLRDVFLGAGQRGWTCPPVPADAEGWIGELGWRADSGQSGTGIRLFLDKHATLQTYAMGNEFAAEGNSKQSFSSLDFHVETLATPQAIESSRRIPVGAWVRFSGSFILSGGCLAHRFEEYDDGFFPIIVPFKLRDIREAR